mmetsp:Transcript_22678/g.64434  ORF Transcript_22678/g.64434 Transcript_22678/m.64434 type:complete len:277 (-) Transcript_22678:96-926(-)
MRGRRRRLGPQPGAALRRRTGENGAGGGVEHERRQVGPVAEVGAHALRLEGAVHAPLVVGEEVGRNPCDAVRHLEDLRFELRLGEGAVGKVPSHRRGSVHGLRQEHDGKRVAHATEPGVDLKVWKTHVAALGVAYLGALSDVHKVARSRELHARPETLPMDLGNDGLGEVHDLEPSLHGVANELAVRVLGEEGKRPARERDVYALAKVLAGAAHDRDAHVGVLVVETQLVEQLRAHDVARAVAARGRAERDARHKLRRPVHLDLGRLVQQAGIVAR